jgi:GDPmannose 4,6-dehydratase
VFIPAFAAWAAAQNGIASPSTRAAAVPLWRGLRSLQQRSESDDYVLATGESHSVREFVEKTFMHVGKRIEWRGSGVEEKGVDAASGRVLIEIDCYYFRPTDVDTLIGDPSKARQTLGWHHKVSVDALIREMVEADLEAVRTESICRSPQD